MARPQRHKLKFNDEDSANKLLQEIYIDTQNIKATLVRLFNKWEIMVKEDGNVAAIGETIIKLIAQEHKNTDIKLMILKYLKEVIYAKETGPKKVEEEKETKGLSTQKRLEILEFVNTEMTKRKLN